MIETKQGDTLGVIFDRVAARYPKQEAMVLGEQRMTYDMYIDRVNSMANALLKVGVK
ncbi:MAG: hypothetical protein MUP21_07645 [Dehalococcoidia bacterium]|nr:hypothetical protein [Dehalococcoidia bacterium]